MYAAERAALVAAGARLAAGGLVAGTAGNLSVRVGDHVVATASGTVLGELTPERLSVVDLAGTVLAGAAKPTSELPLHLSIYRAYPVAAVAHAHAPASIAVGLTRNELPPVHYLTMLLGGVVRVAGYATFGSAKLAAAVTEALADRSAALLRNHGSVAVGADIAQARSRLELLEWLADVYARAAVLGVPRVLNDAELADAAATFTRLDYGS